jgi:hypothetical protein
MASPFPSLIYHFPPFPLSSLQGTELEIDNTQLKANIAALESQVAALREEANAAALIPQYRLAVVKARAHSASLKQQLKVHITYYIYLYIHI